MSEMIALSDGEIPRKELEILARRPNMPIQGRSKVEWCLCYERDLSDFFHVLYGRYADSMEWEIHCDKQFNYQQTLEAI